MSTKKVSYTKLLKEALSTEWDTTKTVDTKGPMLDPILGYDGGGELETNKDAASILERYYFKEEVQEGLIEAVENELDEDPQKKAIPATKKDIEDEIDDGESGSATFKEGDEPVAEQDDTPPGPPEEKKEEDEEMEESLKTTENSVIEKLISEMEEEGEDEEEEKKEEKMEEGEKVTEQDAPTDEEELDVDEKVEDEEDVNEVVANPSVASKVGVGDGVQKDEVEEAFNIFREQISDAAEEEEDEKVEEKVEIKSDDIQV